MIWAEEIGGIYYNKSGHIIKHVLYVTRAEAVLAKIGNLEADINTLKGTL